MPGVTTSSSSMIRSASVAGRLAVQEEAAGRCGSCAASCCRSCPWSRPGPCPGGPPAQRPGARRCFPDAALGLMPDAASPASARRRERRYRCMAPRWAGCRPAMASSSSFWPLPAMPAMPRISPPYRRQSCTSSSTRDALGVADRSGPRPPAAVAGFTGSGRSMFSATALAHHHVGQAASVGVPGGPRRRRTRPCAGRPRGR